MSPLKITLLLHYYSRVDDYGATVKERNAPAVHEAIAEFMRTGMLTPNDKGKYDVTEKGQAYIKVLTSLPLPVATWAVPGVTLA